MIARTQLETTLSLLSSSFFSLAFSRFFVFPSQIVDAVSILSTRSGRSIGQWNLLSGPGEPANQSNFRASAMFHSVCRLVIVCGAFLRCTVTKLLYYVRGKL